MDSSKNGRWTVPFKNFSRLRVKNHFSIQQYICLNPFEKQAFPNKEAIKSGQ